MTHPKLRIHNTALDNLVSNLRGEVGEITHSWILMRGLLAQANRRRSEPGVDPFADHELNTLYALADRLEGDIVARLSELAEDKVGRLNFHFASKKLAGKFDSEAEAFSRFVETNRFTTKRNQEISHKECPEQWSQHAPLHIPYRTILKTLAFAMRLMKRIDHVAVGPEASFFWPKLRHRRYDMKLSAHVEYMIAPLIKLTQEERGAVLAEEAQAGTAVWEPMSTKVNGQQVTVLVNKKWAGILVSPQQVMFADNYPLNSLESIEIT